MSTSDNVAGAVVGILGAICAFAVAMGQRAQPAGTRTFDFTSTHTGTAGGTVGPDVIGVSPAELLRLVEVSVSRQIYDDGYADTERLRFLLDRVKAYKQQYTDATNQAYLGKATNLLIQEINERHNRI